jgi:hypothetical protein
LADAADEDFAGALLLFAGNGSLRIDLDVLAGVLRKKTEEGTYDLAIEVVLLHHDGVDALGVAEGEETEASRAAGC